MGADTLVTDSDHHALAPHLRVANSRESVAASPVSIGAGVFIGARAVILKGSSIGDGAVIGAGAVVTGVVPPNSLVVGNPARVVDSLPAFSAVSGPLG
jgi:acetyltransferase-like isoleucine patch superfamily enzyme